MAETVSDINGGNNDYATLVLWEADKDGDITAGNAEAAEIYGSYSRSAAGDICLLAGWTTDADSYIRIAVPSGSRRNSSDPLRVGQGVTLTANKSTGFQSVIEINAGAEFTRIDGLEMIVDADSGAQPVISISLGTSTTVADIKISNCILVQAGADLHDGIYITELDDSTAHVIKIWDTVIYNCDDGILSTNYGSGHIVYVYNCDVNGCSDDGIVRGYGTVSCYNVISYNNSGDDFAGTIGGDYNMSEDATAPGANSLDSGTGGNDPKFVNTGAGTEDFKLQATSDAIDAGTDDPGSSLYSTDIDGVTWTSPWDMGAWQVVAAAAGVVPQIQWLRMNTL